MISGKDVGKYEYNIILSGAVRVGDCSSGTGGSGEGRGGKGDADGVVGGEMNASGCR